MAVQGQPGDMRAVAFDGFGGPEVLTARTMPVPDIDDDEILIKVWSAGVGVWDVMHREGVLVPEGMTFPMIPGSDAAGTVVAVGADVDGIADGELVYTYAFSRPKGGCYAEYVAVKADFAAPVPSTVPPEHAGAMPTDALTALCGLDTLGLLANAVLLVFGASGGQGHLAVQLAKRQGLRVVAVASGADGMRLVSRLGADLAVDGHADADELIGAIREAAPDGVDGVLAMAGGPVLQRLAELLRPGGTLAYPHGVQPEPDSRTLGVTAKAYDGVADADHLARLNQLIEAGPFEVHVAETYPLAEAARAHRRLQTSHPGKLLLRLR